MLQIPYIFQAGTKAKAQEVNDNFSAVAQEVNANGSEIASAKQNITTLTNTKADLNGSGLNRFSVASPINSGDAVNKGYLSNLVATAIFGLNISKADVDYITCTKGAAFDSTNTTVLGFNEDVSKQNANQSANTTYYVYIVGNQDGTATDLHFSTSSDNPALPAGYTLFRKLGYFVTNDDSEIVDVFGNAAASQTDIQNVVSSSTGYPDLTRGVTKTWNTDYSADEDGWVKMSCINHDGNTMSLLVNNIVVSGITYQSVGGAQGIVFNYMIKKGWNYKAIGGNSAHSLVFYPNIKGV